MNEDDTYNRLIRTEYLEVYDLLIHMYIFDTTVYTSFEEFLYLEHILPEYIKRDQLLKDHHWTRPDFISEYIKRKPAS